MKSSLLPSALKTMFSMFRSDSKKVHYAGTSIAVDSDETVLDALLRNGHQITYNCRGGACQSCLLVADRLPPAEAQKGLTDGQKALNYLLACQCKPDTELHLKKADSQDNLSRAEVIEKSMLNASTLRLRLKADLHYYPGQYMTLWRDQVIARSYSLASHPDLDDFIEFHIRVIDSGQFSAWASEELNIGEQIELQGPIGQCFYTASPAQPLLMAAIGTGLAPVYGIVRDALHQGHRAPIRMIVGAANIQNFYLVDELLQLSQQYPQVGLHFVCQSGSNAFAKEADIYQFCKEKYPDLKGQRIFLCGAESFVKKMKKQCFLAGAAMGEISSDAFLTASK